MKINDNIEPKSSFLSTQKDTNLIIQKIIKNKRLQRLLHYNTSDCLDRPNLKEDEVLDLIKNNIKLVPKMKIDSSIYNYIFIQFDNFMKNITNPEFRDNTIEIDILCHYDQWLLPDFKLRPYVIAAELDSMLDNEKLTGIGKLEFLTAKKIVENNEFGGVCLIYRAVHGEEDKKFMLNPADEDKFLEDFYSQFLG